ncbi:unnamed protein product [Gadus morhua 'NCC']
MVVLLEFGMSKHQCLANYRCKTPHLSSCLVQIGCVSEVVVAKAQRECADWLSTLITGRKAAAGLADFTGEAFEPRLSSPRLQVPRSS